MNPAAAPLLLQAPPEPSPFGMLVPMAAIFMIFYFLLIRPQQKKQRNQEDMLKGIEKGDSVVTAGGRGDPFSCAVHAHRLDESGVFHPQELATGLQVPEASGAVVRAGHDPAPTGIPGSSQRAVRRRR